MPKRALVALGLAGFVLSLAVTFASGDRGTAGGLGPAPLVGVAGAPPLRPASALAGGLETALARPVAAAARRGLGAYRGAGAWVDQYDAAILQDPWPALREMKAHGVRTVYLETGSWRLPRSLDFRDRTGAALAVDQAHALGMKVVAWYLPGLDDVPLDMRRTRALLALRTDRGGRFDGCAIDIESQRVGPLGARNAALLRYSRALRRAIGPRRAIGAIVPDQRSSTVSPGLWPGFPYAAAARLYDVFLPMAYSTYRGHGASYVYGYARANVAFLRAATRRPVHLVGGLDQDLAPDEPAAIVRGARDGGAIGASFYDFAGAQDETWRALRLLAR